MAFEILHCPFGFDASPFLGQSKTCAAVLPAVHQTGAHALVYLDDTLVYASEAEAGANAAGIAEAGGKAAAGALHREHLPPHPQKNKGSAEQVCGMVGEGTRHTALAVSTKLRLRDRQRLTGALTWAGLQHRLNLPFLSAVHSWSPGHPRFPPPSVREASLRAALLASIPWTGQDTSQQHAEMLAAELCLQTWARMRTHAVVVAGDSTATLGSLRKMSTPARFTHRAHSLQHIALNIIQHGIRFPLAKVPGAGPARNPADPIARIRVSQFIVLEPAHPAVREAQGLRNRHRDCGTGTGTAEPAQGLRNRHRDCGTGSGTAEPAQGLRNRHRLRHRLQRRELSLRTWDPEYLHCGARSLPVSAGPFRTFCVKHWRPLSKPSDCRVVLSSAGRCGFGWPSVPSCCTTWQRLGCECRQLSGDHPSNVAMGVQQYFVVLRSILHSSACWKRPAVGLTFSSATEEGTALHWLSRTFLISIVLSLGTMEPEPRCAPSQGLRNRHRDCGTGTGTAEP
eukprot:gene23219-biopygen23813